MEPGRQGAGTASADDGAKAALAALGDDALQAGQAAVDGRVHAQARLRLDEGEVRGLADIAGHEDGAVAGRELEEGRNQLQRCRLHRHNRQREFPGQQVGRAPAGDDHVAQAAGSQFPRQGHGRVQRRDVRLQRQASRRGQAFNVAAKLGA